MGVGEIHYKVPVEFHGHRTIASLKLHCTTHIVQPQRSTAQRIPYAHSVRSPLMNDAITTLQITHITKGHIMFTYLESILQSFNEVRRVFVAKPVKEQKPGRTAINITCLEPRYLNNQMIREVRELVEAEGHYFKHFARSGDRSLDNFYIADSAPVVQTV